MAAVLSTIAGLSSQTWASRVTFDSLTQSICHIGQTTKGRVTTLRIYAFLYLLVAYYVGPLTQMVLTQIDENKHIEQQLMGSENNKEIAPTHIALVHDISNTTLFKLTFANYDPYNGHWRSYYQ